MLKCYKTKYVIVLHNVKVIQTIQCQSIKC